VDREPLQRISSPRRPLDSCEPSAAARNG
jgi:hypothetical protein